MFKPVIALLCVTLIASFLLGVVFTITEGPIAEQKAKTEMEAVTLLMAGTANTEVSEPQTGAETSAISKITKCLDANGAAIGHVISVSPKGYGGAIDMMVGFDNTGIVQGVEILSHSETPGLGANADNPAFTDQYKGIPGSPLNVVKQPSDNPSDIEAIASSTITTTAVTNGVIEAYGYFMEHIQEAGAVQ